MTGLIDSVETVAYFFVGQVERTIRRGASRTQAIRNFIDKAPRRVNPTTTSERSRLCREGIMYDSAWSADIKRNVA